MAKRITPAAPVFVPPQLLTLEKCPPSGAGWIHEIKFDGYRMQVHVGTSAVTWFSRNGKDWSGRFPDLDAELLKLGPCVLDGELCIVDSRGHPDFSALRSALGFRQRGRVTGDLTLFVFDVLAQGREDLKPFALKARKAVLAKLFDQHDFKHLRLVDHFETGGANLLQSACQMELEGVVSKRLDAPYKPGERNATWIKAKCRSSQEVVIGGWETEGTKFKSLLAGVYERGQLTYVGHLSTGFGRDALDVLLPKLRPLESSFAPFATGGPPRKTSNVHWAEPKLVAAAEIAEWTGAGKLRQASYKGLRDDKRAKDVIRERPAA